MQRAKSLLLLVFLGFSTTHCATTGVAASAGAALPVGLLLDQLSDRVQQMLEQARNAGRSLEIEGGIQLLNTIANAREAYKDSLNLTIDRVDGTFKSNIDKISGEVQALEHHTISDARELTNRLDVIVKSLPFREHQPYLMSARPSFFAVPSDATGAPIMVVLTGSFEQAANRGLTPQLYVANRVVEPAQTLTNSLSFAVPRELFLQARLSNTFAIMHADLHIPWLETHWYGDKRFESTFPVSIGLLPANPGRISVVIDYTEPIAVTRHYKGVNHHLSSQREGGNDDHKDVPSADYASPGCTIMANTVRIIGSGHGDQNYGITSVTASVVSSIATTIHHGFGESSVNDYWIEFDENCPSSRTGQATYAFDAEHTSIGWSETRLVPLPTPPARVDRYSVVFIAFDGTRVEWSSANSNRFLTLKPVTNALEISIADPAQISWY